MRPLLGLLLVAGYFFMVKSDAPLFEASSPAVLSTLAADADSAGKAFAALLDGAFRPHPCLEYSALEAGEFSAAPRAVKRFRINRALLI
jgi:hypothetical protein